MSQNRFWYLLAKKLSGEALPEEVTELEKLIKENPEWVYAAEHVESLWKLSPQDALSYDTELAFELHLNRHQKNGLRLPDLEKPIPYNADPKPKFTRRAKILWSSLLAATLLILASISWIYRSGKSADRSPLLAQSFNEVSTRAGSRTRLVLADSTVVWLNAGSRLTYNEHFGSSNRNATLVGEAFFDVRKSHIPFILHANGIEIKVLGTAFNVKSYPNEKTTETSLLRGRVEITLDKRPGEKFILKPNEKLIVANETPELKEKKPENKEPIVVLSGLTHTREDLIVETSWVDNRLVFQDESFADIAKKMERWYDVHIEIKDEKIAQMRLTGTFEKESIKQALTALQIAFPFNFSINQSNITITK